MLKLLLVLLVFLGFAGLAWMCIFMLPCNVGAMTLPWTALV